MISSQVYEIILVAIGASLLSIGLQTLLTNKKKQLEIQNKMKDRNLRIRELMKKNDEKSRNESSEIQKQMMNETMEMMQDNTKFLIVSMIVFLPLLGFVMSFYSKAGVVVNLLKPLVGFNLFGLYPFTIESHWFWIYFGASLITSLVVTTIVNSFLKKKYGIGMK